MKCSDCHRDFSKKYNMLRHRKLVHDVPVRSLRPPTPQLSLTPEERQDNADTTILLHPFTMMISGPTACGKTTLVTTLLQKHTARIQPGIRRIVYLYKRWQPLYDVIAATVAPRVEFKRGIPADLDDDDYFDSSINNLLILDDIHSEAGKDKRITGLFTEGSHHRSLSVISINQNLYGAKDPTQKRNTQYMILYNTPVDRQCVLTLARQMYPGNAERFTTLFDKATKRPYQFFFIDLKPTTPEDRRLIPDVRWPDDPRPLPAVTGETPTAIREATRVLPNAPLTDINPINEDVSDHSSPIVPSVQLPSNEHTRDTMLSCDDCGVLFENEHDLQNHVKRWCPEGEDGSEEPTRKRMKLVSDRDNDSLERADAERGVYEKLARYARDHNDDERKRKVAKYRKRGLSAKMATEKANQVVREDDVRAFLLKYTALLTFFFKLKDGYLHEKITNTIETYLERGMTLKNAIRLSVKKYNHHFEEIMEDTENDVDEDDTDEKEDDVNDDDETEDSDEDDTDDEEDE